MTVSGEEEIITTMITDIVVTDVLRRRIVVVDIDLDTTIDHDLGLIRLVVTDERLSPSLFSSVHFTFALVINNFYFTVYFARSIRLLKSCQILLILKQK